jgi:hypothetical protein
MPNHSAAHTKSAEAEKERGKTMPDEQATERDVPPLPPKVAAAMVKVMAGVPKLTKNEKNTHGNYNFASIDDFLEAVRPLCAEAGLILVQDEEYFEIKEGHGKDGKPKAWLIVRFRFTLAHSSGETWAHRPSRTIMVDAAMGSQAFGAAQSYSLKQFERSLFQIATGELDDADRNPQENLPPAQRKTSRSLDWRGPLSKTELQAHAREIVRTIEGCTDDDQLTAYVDSDEVRNVLAQMKHDIPDWWDCEREDFIGIKQRIRNKRDGFERAS